MKKKDLVVIGVILAVILLSFALMQLFKKEGDYVLVRVEGKEVARYSLQIDGEYQLNGGTNVLKIQDGKAYLIYADCPDHLCINQGKVSQNGQTITCLPNRLTITVVSNDGGTWI
ncbi:MAG: NusG domain II-containing protein [Clostridia bacterium]|nr:NusG domain II-containing protein [Clostridia bacterium]